MRRNTVLAVLVALLAILFFAVVPSVSASAATGPTPGPTTPACSATDCAPLPPALPLTPKDPSQDVTPPDGTVPLDLNGCEVSKPCTNIEDPEASQPPSSGRFVEVSVRELKQWDKDYSNLQVHDSNLQVRAYITQIWALVASGTVISLLIVILFLRRNQRSEPQEERPGYKLN